MPTRITLFVFFLTALAAFLHFFNLTWGAPFFFHPDERNIASSVSQLRFPEAMNPKFFAYGSLPIYTIYYTGLLANNLPSCQLLWDACEKSSVSFSQALLLGRFYSALFSTLLIPLLFFLGRKIKDEKTGLIAAFLATTSVGLIQFAHFGTFEMWLTFFGVLLFWFCLEAVQKKSLLHLFWLGIVFGILVATKVSSIALFPLPLLALVLQEFQNTRKTRPNGKFRLSDYLKIKRSGLLSILTFLRNAYLVIFIAVIVYVFTNPYVFSDYHSFKGSIHYESGVALGTIPVFYTGEFFDTSPILFQLQNVYPFLLNPLIFLIALPSFFFVTYLAKKQKRLPYLFLILFFLFLFLSQAFLFVKWTRYMVPTLPFMYLMIAIFLSTVIARSETPKQSPAQLRSWWGLLRRPFGLLAMTIVIVTCSLFAVSYFITAFLRPDTRIAAAAFAKTTIPSDSKILSEVYDLGIVPFTYPDIKLYNFYDLDSNSSEFNELTLNEELENVEYIILPSQRVIKSRLLQAERFPNGYKFYTQLFNGTLGFKKIYETPCDIFCQITYMGNPSFTYEQTANVFDRPTVYIFKKMR